MFLLKPKTIFLGLFFCCLLFWAYCEFGRSDAQPNAFANAQFLPKVIEFQSLARGKNLTIPFQASNPSHLICTYRGANWTCGASGCFSIKETNEMTIPPGGTIEMTAYITSRSVGDFDCTIEAYLEIAGVLKTIPIRAVGKIVEADANPPGEK